MVGIPHFLSPKAYEEEKNDLSLIRQAKNSVSEEVDNPEDAEAVRACVIGITQRMQAHFKDRIIRRTADSLDWKNEPLISLPPWKEIMVIVKITSREMEIISELADSVKERYLFVLLTV